MSFADSMDDLDAMSDPRNTAESVAAAHLARKSRPGRIRRLFVWLRSLAACKASGESRQGGVK